MKRLLAKLKLDIISNPRLWLSRLMFALGIPVTYCMVELLAGNNPFGLEFWRLIWNIGWYMAIFAFFWLLTGQRRRAGGIAASVFLFIAGLVNHYVLRFRGTMFFPIDILSWKTAVNVAGGYDFTPDAAVWWALVILAAYSALLALTYTPRPRRSRRFAVGVASALTVFLLVFFASDMLPAVELYAEQWQTRKNGFVFNFAVSLRYSYVTEPDGYDSELVEDIQNELVSELDEEPTAPPEPTVSAPKNGRPTNIIIIMNESLADFSLYNNLPISRDPLEFIHSMDENTVKGWLFSPVFGGGTANVEYEVLTGNPSEFLPDGTVAYQLYIDRETPSLATLAEYHGYSTYAFHPYLSSGWNRVQAYEYLGFDTQLYDVDVQEPELVREFISDRSDFEMLRCITEESTEPVFIFNVTMQNHSGYGMDWDNLPYTVRLTGEYADTDYAAEQYLCLSRLTDRAFKELTEYYEKSDEPTLIVMFGDHQPPLNDSFYDILMGKSQDDLSREETLKKYMTPFVIWTNYDIPERQDVYLSANFLGVLISDLAGLERTYYMELVGDIMTELPVIHELGYIGADGTYYPDAGAMGERALELLSDYEIMSYHDLFDREAGDEFYEP